MSIKLYQDKIPTEPGKYLFRGLFSSLDDFNLITVKQYPSKQFSSNVEFPPYLGVSEYGGRNVTVMKGFFSNKIEVKY